jgi:single-strand DNA-binding protein
MRGLNKAYLIGHIGHEPELRSTATGLAVLHLNIATPGSKKVGEEWVESPDWHRLTFFDKSADFVGRHAHKGDVLAVECVIRQGKYTDKDNAVRYKTDLVVDRVLWLNSGRGRSPEVPTDTPELRRGPDVSAAEHVEEPPF